jgi:single-strand DNA-binding protein
MINRVVLVGRLTRDPELRRTQTGMAVASFTIAVDNRTKDANGNKTTSFIPCVAWNQVGETLAKYAHKGSLVGAEGRLNQRTYDAKDGRRVSVIEIICDSVQFLEKKDDSATVVDTAIANDVSYQQTAEVVEEPSNKNVSSIDVTDDDLPF